MSIDRARFEVRCVALCEIIEGPYLIIPAYKKITPARTTNSVFKITFLE